MNDFKRYIKSIIKTIDCNPEEKAELYEEFLDHLVELKKEYELQGFTPEEAVKAAISDFGDSGMVGKELNKSISQKKNIINQVLYISFWIYHGILLFLLFRPSRAYGTVMRSINLEPFKQIITYIVRYNHYNFDTWFFNLFGNIILFMPFTFLLPICFNKAKTLKSSLAYIFMFSLAIEVGQYIFGVGVSDIDDIILNVLGGLLGFLVYKVLLFVLKVNNKDYLL